MGYRAFKIHGWNDGNTRERGRATCCTSRATVGDRMALMLDPACELRTFADALYVGRACDEADYFWYEDPFRDGGVSAFAHRETARDDQDAAAADRARARRGAQGRLRHRGRHRLPARRPRVRHGDHRVAQDRAPGRGARPRRRDPRLRSGAPPPHVGHAQFELITRSRWSARIARTPLRRSTPADTPTSSTAWMQTAW